MTCKMSSPWPLLALLFTAACASSSSTEHPSEAAQPPPPLVIKSSLAVLLEHRGELTLTEPQVAWLDKRDQQLSEENAPLQKTLDAALAHRSSGSSGGGGGHRGGGMGGGMGGMGGGMGGMGGGMRGGGMRGGGGGGGGGGGQNREAMNERHQQVRAAMRQMQDNDTRAYTEAETQLTEPQKPRARELVSQEREKLFKQHEAMRERLGDSGS